MRNVGLFALLFAVWVLWSGLYKPLILVLGVVSCLLCVWLTRRMRQIDSETFRLRPVLRGLGYLPWLFAEIASSNWDVIKAVLAPSVRIDPTVVRLTASQRTDLGRMVYGNSITLTPGTLTVDVDGDAITVHALTHHAARQLLSGDMDRRVTRLEDET